MKKQKITLGSDHNLTPEKVHRIATEKLKVKISKESKKKVKKSRKQLEDLAAEEVVYGVNTGFGALSDKEIEEDDIEKLQVNLIRSHHCGVGDIFDKEIIRAIMVVRLNSLCQGNSGVRLKTLELLVDMINKNVLPLIPEQGSVGSSGDLAPLSHMVLPMLGEGEVYYEGEKMKTKKAFEKAGLEPIRLKSKEGLALINGTSVMTAIGALGFFEAKKMVDIADMGCALSLEALRGCSYAFDERIHSLRPHEGQKISAENIRSFTNGSDLVDSDPDKVQDSYSLRCSPQVHGAVRDSLEHVEKTLKTELNSVTDNPLIFPEDKTVLSGGNFHGEPIAIVMDLLSSAVSELANISERRTAKLISNAENDNLPPFLIPEQASGLSSGLMIPQYTAASLVSENKGLAHPASVDSIPTSANKEDHVSMGTIAARKAKEVLKNSENVLTIEYLTVLQALGFRDADNLGEKTSEVYKKLREKVSFLEEDRNLKKDIEKVRGFIKNGKIEKVIK